MIIYKDNMGSLGDVLLSDRFDIKEIDGVIWEVDCSMITLDGQDAGDDVRKFNNIVHEFRLQSTVMDKASYLRHIKDYAKRVLESLRLHNNPDYEVDTFKKGFSAHSRRILESFHDWEFYTGANMDIDGSIVLLNYREDGTPFLTYWKHALREMMG